MKSVVDKFQCTERNEDNHISLKREADRKMTPFSKENTSAVTISVVDIREKSENQKISKIVVVSVISAIIAAFVCVVVCHCVLPRKDSRDAVSPGGTRLVHYM